LLGSGVERLPPTQGLQVKRRERVAERLALDVSMFGSQPTRVLSD
jgi:uncharacterized membrane protein YheB (UPF0754 family)